MIDLAKSDSFAKLLEDVSQSCNYCSCLSYFALVFTVHCAPCTYVQS